MAQPISRRPPIADPKVELLARLQDAPAEHDAALLSAYEVLQGLHDEGVFELLRGALGSRDQLVEIAVEAGGASGPIRGVRNLMLLLNLVGEIDPAVLAC